MLSDDGKFERKSILKKLKRQRKKKKRQTEAKTTQSSIENDTSKQTLRYGTGAILPSPLKLSYHILPKAFPYPHCNKKKEKKTKTKKIFFLLFF